MCVCVPASVSVCVYVYVVYNVCVCVCIYPGVSVCVSLCVCVWKVVSMLFLRAPSQRLLSESRGPFSPLTSSYPMLLSLASLRYKRKITFWAKGRVAQTLAQTL